MRIALAALSALALVLVTSGAPARAAGPPPAAPASRFAEVEAYAAAQRTTGLLIVRDGQVLLERNWPVPPEAATWSAMFVHGRDADGRLEEDVASAQKSFVALLLAIAGDKGLLDVEKPVSAYVGPGWSKATGEQEAAIRVRNLMEMNSGLREDLTYAAAPGERFFYNTPAYAVLKRVVATAAHAPLEAITRDWLTGPLGMSDTDWKARPASMRDVGNPTGLVTTTRDLAKIGALVLADGRGPDGRAVVSPTQLKALLTRSPTNPAYGRLWWLNGSDRAILPLARDKLRPLVATAPADMVAALGAETRRLYIVPSRRWVVVRLGRQPTDPEFDAELWRRLAPALAAGG